MCLSVSLVSSSSSQGFQIVSKSYGGIGGTIFII